MTKKVLVTGGTGFIAGHIISTLLERGYEVVTTVRSSAKGEKLLKAYSSNSGVKLSYQIVEDAAKKGAYDEAVKSTTDLDFVMHTTSPFHYDLQNPVKDFLDPAVNGTTSILQAIKNSAPSVKRVVFTSSFAAIRNPVAETSTATPVSYDESSWNPVTWDEAATDKTKTYQGSKKLAEKAAWDFIKNENPSFDLVSINPALTFGPAALHLSNGELSGLNTSNVRILDMVQGKMKTALQPTGFFSWVDVRDVALAHVNALETLDAGGKRFLLITDHFSNKEIAQLLTKIKPELRNSLPDDLDELEEDIPGLDKRYRFSNQRSVDLLGIKYTGLETSVRDTVESLWRLGA